MPVDARSALKFVSTIWGHHNARRWWTDQTVRRRHVMTGTVLYLQRRSDLAAVIWCERFAHEIHPLLPGTVRSRLLILSS